MILPQGTPSSPTKASYAPISARQGDPSSAQQPPAYSNPPVMAQTHPFYSSAAARRGSAGSRFLKAFCIAALVWVLCVVLTESVVDLAVRGRHGHIHWGYSEKGWPSPDDGEIDKCIGGEDWTSMTNNPLGNQASSSDYPFSPFPGNEPYSASTLFKLPVNADVLYLLSRGSLGHGKVAVKQSTDSSKDVDVYVTVHYWSQEALDRANVCLLDRRDGKEHGVGIFTPNMRNSHQEDQLRFDVEVFLPASSNGPVIVNDFRTDLSIFSHLIESLEESTEFRSLSLKGSNMPIRVESVIAHQGYIKTSNSPISGSFNSSKTLRLETSNAPITAAVVLTNDDKERHTDLTMRTSNSILEGTISLHSGKSVPGVFDITATTSNSPLKIDFPTQPVDSQLHLTAKTSNSQATVALHPAYEGSFTLLTSIMRPRVEQHEVEDPAGKGRRRHITYRSVVGNAIDGEVKWSDSVKQGPFVDVRTSILAAVLKL